MTKGFVVKAQSAMGHDGIGFQPMNPGAESELKDPNEPSVLSIYLEYNFVTRFPFKISRQVLWS